MIFEGDFTRTYNNLKNNEVLMFYILLLFIETTESQGFFGDLVETDNTGEIM